jgi:hypothetical protein
MGVIFMPMIAYNPKNTIWRRKLYNIGDSFILTLPRYIIGKKWHNYLNYYTREVYIELTEKSNVFIIRDTLTENSLRVKVQDIGLYGIVLTKLNIGDIRTQLKSHLVNYVRIEKQADNSLKIEFLLND